MPYDQVLPKFERGDLHSGSKTGPKVKSRRQAIAIFLDEKKKAEEGKTEYQPISKPEDAMREAMKRRKR